MKKLTHLLLSLILINTLVGCQSTSHQPTLFDELGGMDGIARITDNFIYEIGFDRNIVKHFEQTNLERFREKFIEQVCEISGGPCQYSGDSMLQVHTKMNITETEFNRTVDLLIFAMNNSGVAHTTQNKLLARLAPTRPDIIYQ